MAHFEAYEAAMARTKGGSRGRVQQITRATDFEEPTEANFDFQHSWLGDMTETGGKTYTNDNCSNFDEYPYGLSGLPDYYPSRRSLHVRYSMRQVTYGAANYDACNLALDNKLTEDDIKCQYCCDTITGQDRSYTNCTWNYHEKKYPLITKCQAMMQGVTRVERAWWYSQYMAAETKQFGLASQHIFTPLQGRHSSCEILQSADGQRLMFAESRYIH
jgi:hypothetical protein